MSMEGTLRLKAVRRGSKTVVADTYFDGVCKVARPVYLTENEPVIYSLQIGGGYVGGDCYRTDIRLEEKAVLTFTTQSAAKVYKSPQAPGCQKTAIHLAEQSCLFYLPDPLIAYEGARFDQETVIHLEKGATLLYSDIITPGWSKSAEPFRYEWIRSKLKLYEDRKLLAFDHLFLQPGQSPLTSVLELDSWTHTGSLLIVSPSLRKEDAEMVCEELSCFQDVRFGLSTLSNGGIVIRILARATHVIEAVIRHCTDWLRTKLGLEPVYMRKL